MQAAMRMMAAALALCCSTAMAQDSALPRAAIEDGFQKAECSVALDEAAASFETFDLGGGQKLHIVACWRAAYQSGSIVFVTGSAGQPKLMIFEHWNGKAFEPTPTLSEADFDPKTKIIATYFKGRGIGDCGAMAEWSWTGAAFKMKAYYFKEKCDGQSFDGRRRWQIFPRK